MAISLGIVIGVTISLVLVKFIMSLFDGKSETDSTDSFGERYSFKDAVVDTDGIWHFNDALSEFKDEISELDRDIKYAEEMKRLEREKADKETYLDSLYLEDEEKDVVYLVRESSFHGGLYLGIYATKTEAKGAKSEIEGLSGGRNVRIEEHTLNRPKKEDE